MVDFAVVQLDASKARALERFLRVPVTLELLAQAFLQLLAEHVNTAAWQLVVQVGDDEVECNGQLDVHDGGRLDVVWEGQCPLELLPCRKEMERDANDDSFGKFLESFRGLSNLVTEKEIKQIDYIHFIQGQEE